MRYYPGLYLIGDILLVFNIGIPPKVNLLPIF
jgi:hypothetical protein